MTSMMNDEKLCLSREEIAEFTRAHTRARQLAFLRNNGIRHYVDNAGWPVVTVSAIEGVKVEPRKRTPWQPSKVA